MNEDNVTSILGPDGRPTKIAAREAQIRLYRTVVDACNHYTGTGSLNPVETMGVLQMVIGDIHLSVARNAAMQSQREAQERPEPPTPAAM